MTTRGGNVRDSIQSPLALGFDLVELCKDIFPVEALDWQRLQLAGGQRLLYACAKPLGVGAVELKQDSGMVIPPLRPQQPLTQFAAETRADWARRIAGDNGVRRHVFRDDRTRANHASRPERDAALDDDLL